MAFLIHPEHGATNVGDGEVEALEKQGWKRATHDDWFRANGKPHLAKDGKAPKVEAPATDATAAPEAPAKPKAKPGPKPKAKG